MLLSWIMVEKQPRTKSSAGVCSLSSKAANSLARDLETGECERKEKGIGNGRGGTYLRRQGLRVQHHQDRTQAGDDAVPTLNQNKNVIFWLISHT